MKTTRLATILIGAACAATAVTALASTTSAQTTRGDGQAARGGTYRVDWESSFDFTSDFDPTGEYSVQAFGLYSNLLVRTLVGYNHVAGPAGNLLVPDLATSTGTIGNGGRTYTFRLKDGIRFGPPLNREITSKDVAFAFERIATKSVGAQYGFYYDVIKGMSAYAQGEAKTISGIKTPNPRTVVFDLTAPTGDFRYRLAMPAAGPMPREVAGCFTKAGAYGRYLISSGPYMLAGSDKLERRELRDRQGVRSDLRLRRRAHARPRAESRLRRRDGQPQGARELPRPVPLQRQLEHRRHLRARRARGHRGRGRPGAADGPAQLQRLAAAAHERERLHGLPHDEPDAAAVRRRPRAPRRQLRRRSQCAAQGARRRLRRLDRDPHRAQRHAARQAQGLRAVRRVRPGRRRQGAGRDEALALRQRTTTASAMRRPVGASTPSWAPIPSSRRCSPRSRRT